MEDLTGKKFGRLTVIELDHIKRYGKTTAYYYLCKCECGKEKVVKKCHLTSGKTRSCGCLADETRVKENIKHGMCYTRIYHIYKGIIQRCNNKKNLAYKDYGARNIKICKEWEKDFISFYNWAINNGYNEKLTIDRIDNNKGYNPDNCRWTTYKEQANNTRRNHIIEYNGEQRTMQQWQDKFNLPKDYIYRRIKRGQNPQEILKGVE